jgi:hypothetical protein
LDLVQLLDIFGHLLMVSPWDEAVPCLAPFDTDVLRYTLAEFFSHFVWAKFTSTVIGSRQ